MIRKTSKHLEMVNEGYFEHMSFALKFSMRMIFGGFGGLIHAIIPAFHQTTASRTVRSLHKDMEERLSRYKHEHK